MIFCWELVKVRVVLNFLSEWVNVSIDLDIMFGSSNGRVMCY